MHCTETEMYCLYRVHIYSTGVCVCVCIQYWYRHTQYRIRFLYLLTIRRKYIILNGDSVLHLCDVFQERKPSILQNLPVCVCVCVCVCVYIYYIRGLLPN